MFDFKKNDIYDKILSDRKKMRQEKIAACNIRLKLCRAEVQVSTFLLFSYFSAGGGGLAIKPGTILTNNVTRKRKKTRQIVSDRHFEQNSRLDGGPGDFKRQTGLNQAFAIADLIETG